MSRSFTGLLATVTDGGLVLGVYLAGMEMPLHSGRLGKDEGHNGQCDENISSQEMMDVT